MADVEADVGRGARSILRGLCALGSCSYSDFTACALDTGPGTLVSESEMIRREKRPKQPGSSGFPAANGDN